MLASSCGFLALLLVGLALLPATSAAGDAPGGYPIRPVRMIVPYPPAGGSDIIGRAVAGRLAEQFKQQFIVDNRGGASTAIGAGIAAQAPADGYTLLLGTITTLATNPNLRAKLPYDPVRSFDPITLFASQPYFIIVHPMLPARSMSEFLAVARAKPGQVHFGSPGVGSGAHLTGELFNSMANTKLVHVGYKGAGPAMIDLVSGQIPMMFATYSTANAMLKSGKLTAVGVSQLKRSRALPDVPTIAESGVPGFSMRSWNGLLAPRGTPRPVLDRVSAEVGAAMSDPTFSGRLVAMGFEPEATTPEEFGKFIQDELALHARIIKLAGLKVE